ncbi:hypothetical protein ACSQ67_010120 [Phaseolus vulgaris]
MVFPPNKGKEKLIDIEEDRLVGEAVRRLEQALATSSSRSLSSFNKLETSIKGRRSFRRNSNNHNKKLRFS